MRFLRRSLLGLLLAAVSLGLVVFAVRLVVDAVQVRMAQEPRAMPARERVFAVRVMRAEPESVTPELEAFGQVQSRRTLEIRAAVGGRVVSLAEDFEEGGTVKAGEVLVSIDPAISQALLDRSENDLLDAEAEVRDADRTLALLKDELEAAEEQAELRQRAYDRQIDLQSRGVATAATVETAELAAASARQAVVSSRRTLAQAEARVDQAATGLARARIARDEAARELEERTIEAEFAGTLNDVTLVEGRLVSANEKLADLVDPFALEVAFRVSTAQYARLLDDDGRLMNAPVRAVLDVAGGDLAATGTISRDSAGTGDMQSGRVIYAGLDDARGFKPGDFVTVEVSEPPLDRVVRLPAAALDIDGTVLALAGEDRLEALPVTLLRRQGNDVLVRGPELAGREIVTARTPLLGPGIKVQASRATGETAEPPDLVELSTERRAKLVAFVEANERMPAEMKKRVLARLSEDRVPAQLVQRIESRIGG